MNKKLTRLTALLLAMLLLMSTLGTALADTLTKDQYNQALTQMQEDLNLIPGNVPAGIEADPVKVTGTTLVPVITSEEEILMVGGSMILPTTTLTTADGYQWQIEVDGAWASIAGETGETLKLTYTMAVNALQTDAETETTIVKVRRLRYDAEGYLLETCDEITVPVNTEPVYDSVKTESWLKVTEYTENEQPDDDYYAAWDFQNMAKNPVSTFALTRDGEGDTPELKSYSVVINYVFENNEVAADPYTATLAAGSSLNTTVTFPVVQGYLPYFGNDEASTTSYTLNIANIQDDEVYTVTYKPTLVNYTVIHYRQNVDNDNYNDSAPWTETLQGLTASTVPEVAFTKRTELALPNGAAAAFEGFYALAYDKPPIAADGSTTVEVYYDRNYYLMLFELSGGYGVEPIYARYGAAIGDVGTPTRAGYTFEGWSLNGVNVDALPATMPSNNVTYTARWKMNETAKVSVVFWGENPNDEGYSYLGTGTIDATPETNFTYDPNDSSKAYLYCGKEAHTHTADCSTASCGITEHTVHTDSCLSDCTHECKKACYTTSGGLVEASKPNQLDTPSQNGVYTYTTGIFNKKTHYYLYLDGKWYCSDDGDENKISYRCSHTHSDDCYSCNYHEHTGECYPCGKEAHTHTNACYQMDPALSSSLWTFIRSETKEVAADGTTVVNVYYDRTTFTLTFKNRSTTVKTITEKWGADIHSEFPIKDGSDTIQWLVPSGCQSMEPGTRFASLDIMPAESITFTYYDADDAVTLYYYVEALPGEEIDYTHDDGKTFTLYKAIDIQSGVYLTYTEEFHDIQGFKQWWSDPSFDKHEQGGQTSTVNDDCILCYTRNGFDIVYYDPTKLIQTIENVPYETSLNSETYNWTPTADHAPAQYEPGSVRFAGWYLNPECSGTPFDFTTAKMPAGPNNENGEVALSLYAKWVAVDRTITFYLNEADMEDDTSSIAGTHPQITVPHGTVIREGVAAPQNGSYSFVGWFYKDENGEEKAFDFKNMRVIRDMEVYGKWSSQVLKKYTVYFKIKGTDTDVAAPITGSTLAGMTKTFDAKGGTELYSTYQAGYFPEVQSHSLTVNIDHDDNMGDNTFTFWYVQKDAVPYTVYYVAETLKDDATSTEYGTISIDGKTYHIIAETYTNSENRQAVVTEKFRVVSGYMPDAYQKRLVVDVDNPEKNVIVFYYKVDSTHAYYKITHFIQTTAGGENWKEYASTELLGVIGTEYDAAPLTISGFTYDPDADGTLTKGTLTANGLELKLYYVRNSYPYEVRYLEEGTGKQLAEPKKTGNGLYGAVVSESAISIDGYTAVEPITQSLTIKIEESQTEAKLNIITFYYVENEVTINYVVDGPDGCGTVDLNDGVENKVTKTSESVKVKTGNAKGATAAVTSNAYKFVGWYDKDDNKLSDAVSYDPAKVDGKNVAATYYAKFEWNISTLTIEKKGMAAGENAIFTVTATTADENGNSEKTFTVVVPNDGSVTIQGVVINTSYTVTEQDGWTWRYNTNSSVTGTIKPDANENKVTVTNTKKTDQWLSDESIKVNTFDNLNETN